MNRGALIILGRAVRYWFAAVPGLHDYDNKIERVASPRLVNLSVRNLGPDFGRVVSAFQNVSWANPRHLRPDLERDFGSRSRCVDPPITEGDLPGTPTTSSS